MSKISIKESITTKKTLKSRDDKRLSMNHNFSSPNYANQEQKFAKNPLVFSTEKIRSKLHRSLISSEDANILKNEEQLENIEDKKTYVVFWRDLNEDRKAGGLIELKIEANPFTLVEDFVSTVVNKLNKTLTESRSFYLLSKNKDLFSLLIAKKTGEPKTDYPEFDKGQSIHNSGSTNFYLKPKDEFAIVWLLCKPAATQRMEYEEPTHKKSEQDLTDSKSSENSFCGAPKHYRNSLIMNNTKSQEIDIKGRKNTKKHSLFFRIFCSFSCFN